MAHPLAFDQVITRAIKRTREVFPSIVGLVIIATLVESTAFALLATYRTGEEQSIAAAWQLFMNGEIEFSLTSISISAILNLVTSSWLAAAILSLLFMKSGRPSFAQGLKLSWKVFPDVLIASFLTSIAILFGVLLIIPGIILAVWFTVVPAVVVGLRKTGINALVESRELVRGHWWRVFAIYFVTIVVIAVLAGMAMASASAYSGLIDFAISLFVVPFEIILGFTVFSSLRKLKRVQ